MDINLFRNILLFIDQRGATSMPEIASAFHLTPELFHEIIRYLLLQGILSDASLNSPPSCETFKCKFCPYVKSCGTKAQLNRYTLNSQIMTGLHS